MKSDESAKGGPKSLNDRFDLIKTMLVGSDEDDEPHASKLVTALSVANDNLHADISQIGDLRKIDRYHLQQILGKGSFGTVYQAVDSTTGARCAVKIASTYDRPRAASLEREAQALAGVNHPGIVKVYGLGRDSRAGVSWVAMELVDGTSLEAYIQRRCGESIEEEIYVSFESNDAIQNPHQVKTNPRTSIARDDLEKYVRWFREGASALQNLAEIGIVHRDIKPENLMVSRLGGLRLIDFGLSFDIENTDLFGELAGTIGYMSPEQTQSGFAGHDGRSDVYSLAVSFWELLTGKRAVDRKDNRRGRLLQVVHDSLAPVSSTKGVPRSLDPIFSRALAKDVRFRYQNASELEEDLSAWLKDDDLVHVELPRTEKVAKWARHHSILAVGLTLLILSTVTWFSWSTYSNNREQSKIMATARNLIATGKWQDGSTFFAQHAEEFEGDNEFLALYLTAITNHSGRMIDKMFAEQGVVVQGLFKSDSVRASDPEIAIHLRYCPCPRLVSMAAFAAIMDGEYQEALNFIGAHPTITQTNLIKEIQLIAHIGLGDWLSFRRVEKEINPLEASNIQSNCVRAFRLFQQDSVARKEGLATLDAKGEENEAPERRWPPVSKKQFKSLRDALQNENDDASEHRMVMFFLALAQFQLGQPAESIRHFRKLTDNSTNDFDKAGTQIMLARALIFAAHSGHGDLKSQLDRANELCFQAIRFAPSLAETMAFWLTDLEGFQVGDSAKTTKQEKDFRDVGRAESWRTLSQWMEHLLHANWPPDRRPALGIASTYIAAKSVTGASIAGERETALNLISDYLSWFGTSPIPERKNERDLYTLRIIDVFSGIDEGLEILSAKSLNEDGRKRLLKLSQNMSRSLTKITNESPDMVAAESIASGFDAIGQQPHSIEKIDGAREGLFAAIDCAKKMQQNKGIPQAYVDSLDGTISKCRQTLDVVSKLVEEK